MVLKKLQEQDYSAETRLIYGKSFTKEWDYTHHVIPPLSMSSTFRLDSARRGAEGFEAIPFPPSDTDPAGPIWVYDRMGEPNNSMLQNILAVSEGCDCAVTFSTGMAAIHAALGIFLESGLEVISHATIYGCTYSLLEKWFTKYGVKSHFVDLSNADALLPLVTPKTRVLYLESPANPTLQLLDLEAIMVRVNEINKTRDELNRIITIMDNTFATPFCQRPAEFGVDMVVHSLTKGLSGFGTHMGGAVVTKKEYQDDLILFRKDFGGTLSPYSAWNILVYGLSTLSIRVPKQQENAMKVAQFLETHPLVDRVMYPGLPNFPQYEIAQRMLRDYNGKFAPGFIVYFTLKGTTPAQSKERGEQMMDFIAQNSYTITLAVSLGQLRTLIEHPGSMTHLAYSAEEQLKCGIDPGGIRLAVGIENADDIIKDLSASLEAIKGPVDDELVTWNRGMI